MGSQVIGFDLSVAAEVASHNLADHEFIAFQVDASGCRR